MHNDTIVKFGYPETLLKEYRHWVVLLRPKQVTLGSLILAHKGDAERLSQISPEAFTELTTVTAELELVLERAFRFDKINYLLLMMVDKYVHFHIIPRYAAAREALGTLFNDSAWPKPPVLTTVNELNYAQFSALVRLLKSIWPKTSHS